MPKFHAATPAYPIVRKIGPADLKDALAKGVDDFWAMPTSLVFLGLIYPDRRHVPRRLCSAPAFSAHGGFRSVWSLRGNWLVRDKPTAGDLALRPLWAHAFDLRHSPSIPSLLALGLLLLVIFICWEFTAQSLYVSLLGSTPPESFTRFIGDILGTPQGWKLIGLAPRSVSSLL